MLATDIAQAVIKDKDVALRSKSSVELSLSLISARAAVRKELGIDPPAES